MQAAGRRSVRLGITALVAAVAMLIAASTASAFSLTPVWQISQQTYPTHVAPGGRATIIVKVINLGAVDTVGPVTVTNTLPAGMTAVTADTGPNGGSYWDCPGAAGSNVVTCTMLIGNRVTFGPEVYPKTTAPELTIVADVDPSAGPDATNTATVSGGGAVGDTTSSAKVTISDQPAGFGIVSFTGGAINTDGTPARQAGAHPDVTTDINFTTESVRGGIGVVNQAKEIDVELPRGLVGDPTVGPTCSAALLADPSTLAQCPPETQVGSVELVSTYGAGPYSFGLTGLYNIDAPADSPGRFAFNVNGVIVTLDPKIRTGGDYGITAHVPNVSQSLPIAGTRVTLWGVPADRVHDPERLTPMGTYVIPGARSTAQRRAFITTPTQCSGQPVVTRMSATSWPDPSNVKSASFDTNFDGSPLLAENCGALDFRPGFEVRAESAAKRGAPAGIGIDLTVPQNDNPDGLATANLKTASVTLPDGMVVNPSSAQGLSSCSPAQIDINGASRPTCPEASKIGTIDIVTPLLRDSLQGSIYLASQRQNPFGTTLALYLVAEGSGVILKLPGRIDPNPVTGRVTATFDDNPQLPFEKLSLHFKTGPRAPLSLPKTCGPATTTAVLTPWSGTAPVTVSTSFNVSYDGNGAPCPAMGFNPSFTAGVVNAAGGKDSTFTLGFARTDDDQELGAITVDMPRGLLARIASTTLCGEGQANAGTCGEASKIGNVTTAAGAGSNPFSLPGRVYITGPYKGAPFGLSIVVPAVAGPFNLGTVVVRAAIFLDRNTAELRIVSDPLPTILEGIPLQIRLVEVKVDRPGFMINPTSCTAQRVAGAISSTVGALARVSSRFQVGDCAALPYKPKMSLKVGAKGKLTRGKRTPLDVTLSMTRGQANNRSVQVTLPKTINARLDVVNRRVACTIEQFRADRCPNVVGTGTAVTPLLRDPLKGPAYFVYNPARRLPDLVIRLKGQVEFDLVGKVLITRDLRLQTTFDTVPDVPITKFRLQLASGPRNGPVGLTRNVCSASVRRTLAAQLGFVAQSNKKVNGSQKISVAGCGRASSRGRSGSRRTSRRGSARR